MIITSEHDFSSANTYIHLGYASAQNWNVATHEDDMASGSARDWKWGSRGGVCSHRGVMRTDSIYDENTRLRHHTFYFRAEWSRAWTEKNRIID